jgi:BlaI family transcriptional regulator, penicillinase repressor
MNARPSEFEVKILRSIWKREDGATVNEVLDEWPEAEKPLYTTVLKMLQLMEEKGFVTHQRAGRSYRYLPLMKREEVSRGRFKELLEGLFGGDKLSLANALVREMEFSPDDVSELRALLAEADKKEKKK